MSRAPEPRPATRAGDATRRIEAAGTLVIPRSVADTIERELESAYPGEGCGVLLGRVDGRRRLVRAAVPSPNRWPGRSTRYRVDPDLLRRLLEEEEAEAAAAKTVREASARVVVGFFHSHPDAPPEPSATDLEHAWPWYHYLIIPVRDGRAGPGRAWMLSGGQLRECRLLVDEHGPNDARTGYEGHGRE